MIRDLLKRLALALYPYFRAFLVIGPSQNKGVQICPSTGLVQLPVTADGFPDVSGEYTVLMSFSALPRVPALKPLSAVVYARGFAPLDVSALVLRLSGPSGDFFGKTYTFRDVLAYIRDHYPYDRRFIHSDIQLEIVFDDTFESKIYAHGDHISCERLCSK